MIIRKPYAFLIKYFKVIHIVLFILMGYLLFQTRNIYMFFKNYLITGTYPFVESLVSNYINPFMFIIIIILIASLLLILFLMKEKKKTIIYYLSASIFYIITFISLIIFISVFNYLETQTYSNQILVLLRDLSMVLYYVNYYYITVAFIRGFGFNIKKFNFEKDIKELDISDEDREEIEVGVTLDYDKISHLVNKNKRNIKYYIKENSYILTIFLVIFILSFTSYLTLDKLVFNKMYQEGETFVVNNIEYNILNSYITNLDQNNNVINSKKDYLIVDFSVLNKNLKDKVLKIDSTRIKIKDKYYYPKTNLGNKFLDIGTLYKEQSLINNKLKNYIMVFELNKNDSKENIVLELYYGSRVVDGNAIFYYKEIKLTPTYFKDNDLGEFNLNDSLNINLPFLNENNFLVVNYNINNTFNYKYTKCNNETDGTCLDFEAVLVPSINKTLLEIEYSFDNSYQVFDYMMLEYVINGEKKESVIKNVTPNNYPENKVVLEVDSNIKDASSLKLLFNKRGVSFKYNLKNGDTNE